MNQTAKIAEPIIENLGSKLDYYNNNKAWALGGRSRQA